jgi:hypothetical protein
MNPNKAFDIYNKTFGEMKKDDQSWQSFIKMLIDFQIIDDQLYNDLKQRSSAKSIELVENRSFIPTFENYKI